MSRTTLPAALLIVSLVSAGSLCSQEPKPLFQPGVHGDEPEFVAGLGWVQQLKPEEIPAYDLVTQMFILANEMLKAEPRPRWYHGYLEEIGIDPGSKAADAFTRALFRFREIHSVREHNTRIDDDHARYLYTLDTIGWKARELAATYSRLLDELEMEGFPIEKLESFVDDRTRGRTSMMTFYFHHPDSPRYDDTDMTLIGRKLRFNEELEVLRPLGSIFVENVNQ